MPNDSTNSSLLNTGDISRAIGLGVVLPAKFIEETLGVAPTQKLKAASLFTHEQVADIYQRLGTRLGQLASDAADGMLDVPPKPAPKEKPAAATTGDDDEL